MPFTPFSQERLDEFLAIHQPSDRARQYINDAFAKPSRNVGATTRNVVSDNPCPKMGCSIQAESDGPEARVALDFIFDEDVVFYVDQAPPIELNYVNRNARRIRTTTTPDFLVGRISSGLWLEERKAAADRDCLVDAHAGRYELNGTTVVSVPAQASASALGMKYIVGFDDDIPITRTLNQRWLISYLSPEARQQYEAHSGCIREAFSDFSFATLSNLTDSGIDVDALMWSIANGFVQFDWDSVSLAHSHDLILYRDKAALLAYHRALAPDQLVTSIPTYSQNLFSPGSQFVLDGILFTVEIAGVTKLFALSERNESFERYWNDVERLYRKGVLLPALGPQQKEEYALSRLKTASPDQIERALSKLDLLENGSTNINMYSARSLRRWRALVNAATAAGLPAICGLIDDIPKRGFHGSHIDHDLSEDINKLILEGLADNKQFKRNTIYNSVKKKIEASGRAMIARSAFYKRAASLTSLDTIRASQGRKVAYQSEPTYWQLHVTTPIHCERPFELIHIDHTNLDIRPISMITGEVLSRPWLTVVMDAYTRMVLAFWLSYCSPSYLSVMMALYDMFRRFGRRPQSILTDWGAEFGASDLKAICTALHIRKISRPKSAAKFGAVLERMFGITNTEFIHNLAGNAKATKQVRTLTRQVAPEAHAGLYLQDLYAGFEEYFFEIYNTSKHPLWCRSPNDVAADGRLLAGARPHEFIKVEDVLPILLPRARGTTRRIDYSRGIYVNYEYYGNPHFADMRVADQKTPVRIIPFNPGFVLAYCKGQWVQCRSKWSTEFDDADEFVRRSMYEDLLLERRILVKDQADSDMKVLDLIELLNEKAIENKSFWTDRKTRADAHAMELPPRDEKPLPTDTSAALDQQIAVAFHAIQKKGTYGALVR